MRKISYPLTRASKTAAVYRTASTFSTAAASSWLEIRGRPRLNTTKVKKEEEVALDIELVMQVKMFNLSSHGELGMLNFLELLKFFFSEFKI